MRSKILLALLVIATCVSSQDAEFVGPPVPELRDDGFENARADQPEEVDEPAAGYQLLGQTIAPGTRKQLNWQVDSAMGALAIPTPVLVAHGTPDGPTLCLTAAVHGDELNGVEVVRRIVFGLKAVDLKGTVIGIPIVNASGFLRGSRYLPDRRDLNRFFPGSDTGSLASRFAQALFQNVINRCDALVDIHTGSFHRTNLPQIRADLTIESVNNFSRQFGAIAVLHSTGPSGSLRRAATDINIPAVTLEAGEPSRFDEAAVVASVEAVQSLLSKMEMVKRFRLFGEPQPAIYDSSWVRAEAGGILFSKVELGERIEAGQTLATITDPIKNDQTVLRSPFSGRILGMAVNQVVMPGFAAFHVGRIASDQEAIESGDDEEIDSDEFVGPQPPADSNVEVQDIDEAPEVDDTVEPMEPPVSDNDVDGDGS